MTMREVIEALHERDDSMGGELLCNDLQRAMWEFFKDQLTRRLDVRINTRSGDSWSSPSVKVEVVLDNEVISSDEATVYT